MEGSSSLSYVSGSTPTPPPTQKQKKPTLGDKFLSLFKPAEKKEASAPLKNVVQIQSSGLTPDEEKLLKEKVLLGPNDYKDSHRQSWALSGACHQTRITDEPLRLKLLKILLIKLKLDPKTDSALVGKFAFEALFNSATHKINEPALAVFFEAGLSYKDLPLDLIVRCNNLPFFKQSLDTGANPNQQAYSGLDLSSSIFPEGTNSGIARVLHAVSWNRGVDYLTYLLKAPNLDINAPDIEGRTALMSVINRPEQSQKTIPLLLKAGIDQTICDMHQRTGLFYLLMSAEEPSIFESTLATLLEHRLNLNAPFKGSSQFAYCLQLLVDFDLKHAQVQVWSKPHVTANLINMIEQGAELGQVPLKTFLVLPAELQQKLQQAYPKDIASESAETSSGSTPVRLSESPNSSPSKSMGSSARTPRSTDWLDLFWFSSMPTDLCKEVDPNFRDPNSEKVSAFKLNLANAIHKASLDIVFSSKEEDLTAASLKEDLIVYLRPLLEKGMHQMAPAAFETALAGKLNEWKTRQKTVELENAQRMLETEKQKGLLEQTTARIEAAATRTEAAAKKAEVHASDASYDASLAALNQSSANASATYASMSAMDARTSAMRNFRY